MKKELKNLYHGSSKKLVGEFLKPSQGKDSEERPENNLFAVYATDRKDLAIVMGILGCRDVTGGSIGEYVEGKLDATIYGDYPKQKFIYVHHLPQVTFKQTKIDKHQFVSEVLVKPTKTEKLLIKNYLSLLKKASLSETKKWLEKYS